MTMEKTPGLRVKINVYTKQRLPVITWNEKHLSKQVVILEGL